MIEIARTLWESLQWFVAPVLLILAVFAAWGLMKGLRRFMRAVNDLIHDPVGWIFFILVIGFIIYLVVQFKDILGVV